jgi:RNA polymerase sigma-70 factor, ECF subfamily
LVPSTLYPFGCIQTTPTQMNLASQAHLDSGQTETEADVDLLQSAQGGSREALTRLAVQLLPRVRNLVRYLIRGDAEVDDVAQEALVTVLRGIRTCEGQATFYGWVDRVVARSAFAQVKRERQRLRGKQDQSDMETFSDSVVLPDEYLSRRRLVEALDGLPPEQRYALVLHHVLGLTVGEIAAETRLSIETVRTRLRLGRHRLRILLDRKAIDAEAP